jgi:hypothetical protein
MSSQPHQPRIPASTDCPTCRSHAAVFRAQLAGSRLYCARCRKTFNSARRETHSTAFSLGPAPGSVSLADTIAYVPDTRVELDICVEETRLSNVRLPSFSARRRRARFSPWWLRLGFGLAIGVGLIAIVTTMANPTRSGPMVQRPTVPWATK